jgi:hypothetical protein
MLCAHFFARQRSACFFIQRVRNNFLKKEYILIFINKSPFVSIKGCPASVQGVFVPRHHGGGAGPAHRQESHEADLAEVQVRVVRLHHHQENGTS